MAHFRGTVKGNRTEASRLGHKSTGLHVNAASWQGAVDVSLHYDEATGQDVAEVRLARHAGHGTDRLIYRGPVSGANENERKEAA